ncbi:hypothetical protein [Corynebacterium terpenotabidum]|uniref:DUF2567 domain-containing protein n=1 Tax=Corynebacterium terpenotabidum Y-11 TaxID=1200352 RepID=S4XBW7_9CORY|nr:hypothetical protein [Corynebacterium terpenotabidum]AGP30617.1 hypothetical protein A606_04840 [Corynebacterium terpenotabidum Y-11]
MQQSTKKLMGEWGRVVAVAFVVFALAGVVWGFWQPVTTGAVTEDLAAVTGLSGETAAVPGFGGYVLATGLLGAVLAGWMFSVARRLRGPASLVVAGVLAYLGSWIFLIFGNWVAEHFRATDLTGVLTAGQQVTLVHQVAPGVGTLVAPAVALLVYWACALFATDRMFEQETAAG